MPAPAPQPGQEQQQPSFGQSPATQPTPNRGYEAAGMQKLGLVVKQLTEILPLLGAGSDPGQAVIKAISALSKHVPPGSVTPAGEKQQLENMALKNAQQNQQLQALRQQGQQGQQPGQAAAA